MNQPIRSAGNITGLAQYDRQQYLNLETFRKSGEAIRTPVWFLKDSGRLYVRTQTQTGKVKRVRNRPGVRVAPCRGDGKVTGAWQDASARILNDPAEIERVNRLLEKKYGFMKKVTDWFANRRGIQYTVLVIDLM
jgi:PPOX class probable F420-dependent enzyme